MDVISEQWIEPWLYDYKANGGALDRMSGDAMQEVD